MVTSEKVTVEGAFGPGGGGVFGNSPEVYERPGRGVGVGCCADAVMKEQASTNASAAVIIRFRLDGVRLRLTVTSRRSSRSLYRYQGAARP